MVYFIEGTDDHKSNILHVVRAMISIMIDREIDENWEFGKPMNVYEHGNYIDNFKFSEGYLYMDNVSISDLSTCMSTIISKLVRDNKNKQMLLTFAGGTKGSDQHVYVPLDEKIATSKIHFSHIEDSESGSNYCFHWRIGSVMDIPIYENFTQKQRTKISIMSSLSSIICDRNKIFNFKTGAKMMEYPAIYHYNITNSGYVHPKKLNYFPELSIQSYFLSDKPTNFKSNQLYKEEATYKNLMWIKWEDLDIRINPGLDMNNLLSTNLDTLPHWDKISSPTCFISGAEIFGDCYVIEYLRYYKYRNIHPRNPGWIPPMAPSRLEIKNGGVTVHDHVKPIHILISPVVFYTMFCRTSVSSPLLCRFLRICGQYLLYRTFCPITLKQIIATATIRNISDKSIDSIPIDEQDKKLICELGNTIKKTDGTYVAGTFNGKRIIIRTDLSSKILAQLTQKHSPDEYIVFANKYFVM
jgi:hypothetical protein